MKSDKLTFQVKFWALIGPLICTLTLFAFFMKHSHDSLYLPILLMIGVPLCWRWNLLGLAASAALIGGSLAFQYSEIPLNERFWHIGIGISMVISLFITTLSFKELEVIVDTIQVESKSRLENLWKVDEKQKATEEELKRMKEQNRDLEIKVRSFQKFLENKIEQKS